MKTTIKQIQGTTLAALSDSNHWSVFDTSPENLGSDGATGPLEMVLNALGCCAAIDILLILEKRRARIDDFQIDIEAERSEEHPRVFTKVHMAFRVTGADVTERDVERAIQLSMDKYCSVAGMVGKTAEITTSFTLNGAGSD